MIFPIPEPAQWAEPGPVPYSRWRRWLYAANLINTRPQWVEQWRAYMERQQRLAEDMARYQAEMDAYNELMAEYQAEGEHIAERLPYYLHKAQLSYKRTVSDRKREGMVHIKVEYCHVRQWSFDEHAFYFEIDPHNIPEGVMKKDFNDDVAATLSLNLTSTVTIEVNPPNHQQRPGLWIVVEHKAGRGLIPKYVDYAKMFEHLPKTAPPLLFPVGVGVNGKSYYADMDEMITVLIVGSRGAGKSNIINALLCTWLQRARPDQLRLFMTDLKGGLEFDDYDGLPHLGGDVDIKMRLDKDSDLEEVRLGQEICTEPYQVVPMLQYIEAEMDRRQRLLRGQARKISAYNKRRKNKLSYWVVVIDELATLTDSAQAKEAKSSLAELARKGRAVGIYLILATQIPDKSVLTRQIAGNMDCRIVGRMADGPSSGLSLGNGSWAATRLPLDQPGRMIWRWADMVTIQAPLISEFTIKQITRAARTGAQAVDTEATAQAEEIFIYALEALGGLCTTRELYAHFRNHIAKHRITTLLKQWEVTETAGELKPTITLGDDHYYLLPSVRTPDGSTGRQLIDVTAFDQHKADYLPAIRAKAVSRDPSLTETPETVEGETPKTPKTATAPQIYSLHNVEAKEPVSLVAN